MKLLNHKIECKNPNCPGGEIQTTMEGDSGYSNWTVMDEGCVEFKCHGCGKFGSSDRYMGKPNNQLDNFEVTCLLCGSTEWNDHYNKTYQISNCFRTREEAQEAAQLLKKTLKEFHEKKMHAHSYCNEISGKWTSDEWRLQTKNNELCCWCTKHQCVVNKKKTPSFINPELLQQ